jgi:hypothetical protein
MNMKTNLILKAAIALAISAPLFANAESTFSTGAVTTASARLDFQIIIPRVLFLQVGTGTQMATLGTINQIAFTVPAVNVGDGTAINASVASGDIGNGTVTARVIGNNGTIAFTSTTLGALNNGGTDTISYSQIAATVAANTSATPLAHPTLVDAATTTVTLTPTAPSKVMNRDAKWTFTYLNSAVVAPGTYGGVNANNSRVTYTATMP